EPEELSSHALAMSQMASKLQSEIQDLSNQKMKLDAVLSCMKEGVIALDKDGRIISVNKAALSLLDVTESRVRGRLIEEVARNSELHEHIRWVFEHGESFRTELVLRNKKNTVLELHGAVLRDPGEVIIGALFVLHDVTEYKRLERMRTEFVANVSHELRTPITSIKGFVETLAEGAKHNPEELDRFLGIISRQTDRLGAIIKDLLSLAKIERSADVGDIEFVISPLKGALLSAIEVSEGKATSKDIHLLLDYDETLEIRMNPHLFEQAIINLIDNAIKYSPESGEVRINAHKEEEMLHLSVSDHGCGIPKDHLPRLFERFYRVDKARSRELGGTGLGLAIVKHIVQAHGGKVQVESTVGEGTTFTLSLPCGDSEQAELQVAG
ncbi:MAG: PAS domain-containing protein, partial [Bdellovibrionales bacterium]|nr:PAS domain-containing protein [Bdellovibrionales bacterium]